MRALLSLVPLMALPFLAASCDGGSRTADAATLAVTKAAQESSTDSVRFTMELRIIGGDDETVVAPAEGQLDFAAGVGEMIIPQREGEEPIHYIWHDGKTYQSWFDTGYWLGGITDGGPMEAWQPSTQLESLGKASDVRKIGTEVIDGFETTHYRYAVDPEDLSDRNRELLRGVDSTLDVWVGGDRVYRIVIHQKHGPDAQEELQGQEYLVELAFFDWGVDVEVTPPDASLVKSFEELARLP